MPVELWLGGAALVGASLLVMDGAHRVAATLYPDLLLERLAAGTLLAIAWVVLELEALGTAGLLHPVAPLLLTAASWGVVQRLTCRPGEHRRRGLPTGQMLASGWRAVHTDLDAWAAGPRLLAAALGLVLCGLLVSLVFHSLAHPRQEFDAVAGHLPVMVQWLQAGNTRLLPYNTPVSIQAQYPANAELVALWLVLPTHRDFLVQLASFPGTLLAMAAVVLGVRRLGGTRPVALTAALALPLMPEVLGQLVGTNMQDMLMLGGVLAMFALALSHRARPSTATVTLAGLAGGLAMGTRYGAVEAVPTLGLLLMLIEVRSATPRRAAVRAAVMVVGGLVGGAYFYLRNQVLAGDFIYPQSLPWHTVVSNEKLVFPGLRSYLQLGFAPADWMAAGGQLLRYYGPAWVFLVVAAVVLPACALRQPRRSLLDWAVRLVPALVLLAFLAQLGSAGAVGSHGLARALQALQLRYLLMTVGLTLVVLAGLARPRPRVEAWLVPAVLVVTLASALTQPVNGVPAPIAVAGVVTTAALVAAAVVWGRLRLPTRRETHPLVLAAVTVLAVALTPALAAHYDAHRMSAGLAFEGTGQRLPADGGVVAVAGFCQFYALYGPDLSRRVEYLTGRDEGLERPLAGTYEEWHRSLLEHRVTVVVTGSDTCFRGLVVPQAGWVAEHPESFRLLSRDGESSIYRVLRAG